MWLFADTIYPTCPRYCGVARTLWFMCSTLEEFSLVGRENYQERKIHAVIQLLHGRTYFWIYVIGTKDYSTAFNEWLSYFTLLPRNFLIFLYSILQDVYLLLPFFLARLRLSYNWSWLLSIICHSSSFSYSLFFNVY